MIGALLRVEGLSKRYGERVILDIPALALESGVSYVLTGENGSGKSTLLRILAGLQSAEVGGFWFDGRAVSPQKYPGWLRREVVYVHDHPYLFDTSVEHNIAYGLIAHGVPARERPLRVARALAWAGVERVRDVRPSRLSGGEKQRVAIARVTVLNPRVYLLDEPTANLDDAGRSIVLELIGQLCNERSTVLIACHDREVIRLPQMQRLRLQAGTLELDDGVRPRETVLLRGSR